MNAPPTVVVNGKPRPLGDAVTLADLLHALGVAPEGVAVAVDRQVVPRSRYTDHLLADGQRVEILRAVGGG